MDTATKAPQEARATDRVLEALSTLAALLDRTIKEVHSVDVEFQRRIDTAIHETGAALQTQAAEQLEQQLSATRTKLEEKFQNRVKELSGEWEVERERLTGELARGTQTAAHWESERARLNGEIERLARVQAATQIEAEKAIAAMKQASAEKKAHRAENESIEREIARVEQAIKDVSALIEDPATELSAVIRKNVERAELESYLRGIRFALGNKSN
jgi:chromosome segregation ATPase